jgi:hypothetical protein
VIADLGFQNAEERLLKAKLATGRMRTIPKHESKPLPGLHSFECLGARNVRNHLLEHAEGRGSRVLMQSFGVGGEQGPTIKVEREEGQEDIFPDAGLWTNALEIARNLEKLLDRVLNLDANDPA